MKKSVIPKSVRNSLPSGYAVGFLTPMQGTRGVGPGTSGVQPYILIPAGSVSIPYCRLTPGGKYECTTLTKFNSCPTIFTFLDEGSGLHYTCDLDCDNRRPNGDPDANGNCDCDIKQDMCRQGFS